MIRIDDDYEIDILEGNNTVIKDLQRGGEILLDPEALRVLTYLLLGIQRAREMHDEKTGPFVLRGSIEH